MEHHQQQQILKKKRCVLSIDGGGVRGLVPSQILEYLENCLQELDGPQARIPDYFDLIAGTSTGGIIAVFLTAPDKTGRPLFPASEISDFYIKNSCTIFPQKLKLFSSINLFGPKYPAEPLEKVLKEMIGDLKLKDTVAPILVPAFDIKLQQPIFFRTSEAKKFPAKNALLRDVARGTSAAPTFFPPAYFRTTSKTEYNLVDGGLAANNPTYLAVVEALSQQSSSEAPSSFLQSLDNLLVLSLGTGDRQVYYEAKELGGWNTLNWVASGDGAPIINMLMNASADLVDINIATMFKMGLCENNFLRVQLHNLEEDLDQLDNPQSQNLEKLVAAGKRLLNEKVHKVNIETGISSPVGTETNATAIFKFAQRLSQERKIGLQEAQELEELLASKAVIAHT